MDGAFVVVVVVGTFLALVDDSNTLEVRSDAVMTTSSSDSVDVDTLSKRGENELLQ